LLPCSDKITLIVNQLFVISDNTDVINAPFLYSDVQKHMYK